MATKKPAKPKKEVDYNSKLYIGNEMAAFDRKDRGYYDSMTEEEQKKFSPFLMIRWGSSVKENARLGTEENFILQGHYVKKTNENLNRHFFDINTTQHKKLQWLMATTVSPDFGTQYHQWIGTSKSDTKTVRFLKKIYPTLKDSDIELMAEINNQDDLKQLAREHGWSDQDIREEFR
jgi:hypothetical protein